MTATGRMCSFEACGRVVYAKRLCRSHYQNQRAGKELKPIRTHSRPAGSKPCSFEGCTEGAYAKSLCKPHYLQKRRGTELIEVKVPGYCQHCAHCNPQP